MDNSDHAVDLSEVDVVNVSSSAAMYHSGRVVSWVTWFVVVMALGTSASFSASPSEPRSKLTSLSSSGASLEDELKWSQNDEETLGGDGGRGAVANGTQNWGDGS